MSTLFFDFSKTFFRRALTGAGLPLPLPVTGEGFPAGRHTRIVYPAHLVHSLHKPKIPNPT
nr:MAG TPA: hypothetical protein [Caudoviricetes sp.]